MVIEPFSASLSRESLVLAMICCSLSMMFHALPSFSLSRLHTCSLLDTFSCLHGERPKPCGNIDLLLGEEASHSLSLHPVLASDLHVEGDLHLCSTQQLLLLLVLSGVHVKRTLRRLLPGSSCTCSSLHSLPGQVLQILLLRIHSWLHALACLITNAPC